MGVSYNEKEQSFMFDFGHDNQVVIIEINLGVEIIHSPFYELCEIRVVTQ